MYTDHLYIPLTGTGLGHHLHVERTGFGGPAVVLLHGFGTSAFVWRAVAPRLAERGFTAVAVDLLGYGESVMSGDAGTSPGEQAVHVDLALTALRLGAATVVGCGMGALVALLLAAHAPERVTRLVLVDPLEPDTLPGPAIRALQRTTAVTALGANALFGARPLLEPFLQRHMPRGAPMADRLLARHLAPFVGPDGAARLLQLAASVAITDEQAGAIGALALPTLLWQGIGVAGATPEHAGPGDGLATPPVDHVRRWSQRLPGCVLRPMAVNTPAGGLAPELTPLALVSAIGDWIS